MPAAIDTMFSLRVTPWHGLGTIIQDAVTSEEAIKLAGLDWKVITKPIEYNGVESGYNFTVREDTDTLLGVVGGRYKPVQNFEAFDFMDDLLGTGVTYETAGSLSSNKRIWLLAKMPDTVIMDDVIEPYMCLTNNHDGCGSLKVLMTPVRVVCQNTLNLAIKESKRTWLVRHTGDLAGKIAAAKQTLGLATEYMNSFKLESEELYRIKIAPPQFDALKERMFPVTSEMGKRKEEAQLELQEGLKKAWDRDDLNNIRGTGWGFMNAVSDTVTHQAPKRKTENFRENSFMWTMDAPQTLDFAHSLVKEYA